MDLERIVDFYRCHITTDYNQQIFAKLSTIVPFKWSYYMYSYLQMQIKFCLIFVKPHFLIEDYGISSKCLNTCCMLKCLNK